MYSVDIVSQVYMKRDGVKVSRNAQSSDLAINAQNLYVNCKNLLRVPNHCDSGSKGGPGGPVPHSPPPFGLEYKIFVLPVALTSQAPLLSA